MVGARSDPRDKSGLAHVIEHMLFKGTEKLSRDDCALLVQSCGGTPNAFTAYDMTCYHEVMPKDKLDVAMMIESDRMANAAFRPDEFGPEIGVILNERARKVDDSPTGLFRERLFATALRRHPYGLPIIGFPETIKSITRDDAAEHYRRYYTPRNSFLVVCGDVEAEEVFSLAEKHFGAIPTGPVVRSSVPREPEQGGKRYLRMVSEHSSETSEYRHGIRHSLPGMLQSSSVSHHSMQASTHMVPAGHSRSAKHSCPGSREPRGPVTHLS